MRGDQALSSAEGFIVDHVVAENGDPFPQNAAHDGSAHLNRPVRTQITFPTQHRAEFLQAFFCEENGAAMRRNHFQN